jgi:hypothetical protein
MLVERIEGKWIEAFKDSLRLCAVRPGESVAVLSETRSRELVACAFAGSFLASTGAHETARRFTACHFDFPLPGCTVALDGKKVVDGGRRSDERVQAAYG